MKKRRFTAILCLSFSIVLLIVLSSSFFCLKGVDVVFFDEKLKNVSFENNLYLNTKQKLDKIIESVNFDYGKSLFLIEKTKYINKLEFKNPFVKVLKIESVFPDKIVLKVQERLPFYSIKSGGKTMLCDNEFKILSIDKEDMATINLTASKNQNKTDFFDFFDVNIQAFEAGQFFYENNLILNRLVLFYSLLYQKGFNRERLLTIFQETEIEEKSIGTLNINFYTKSPVYGIKIVVENALEDFDLKMSKVIDAFSTLRENERIKTTYGVLRIDRDFECRWSSD